VRIGLLFCGVMVMNATLFSGCMATGIHNRRLSEKEQRELLTNQRDGLAWPDRMSEAEFYKVAGSRSALRLSRFYNWFVPVQINGKTYRFLIDTGSADCTVDPFLAIRQGIPLVPGGTSHGISATGSHNGLPGILPRITLGELEIDRVPAIVQVNSVGFRVLGVRLGTLHGVIGNGLLSRFVVRLDPRRRQLDLITNADFTPPSGPGVSVIPFAINAQGHIESSIRINGKGPFPLLFDTGFAQRGLFLSHSIAAKSSITLGPGEEVTGWGGTRSEGFQGHADSVEIGPITLSHTQVFSTKTWTRNEVVIGDSIFEKYRTTIDYAAGKIYIEDR
jgi:predicted aspartyl protease